jgi:hypothetical protein
VTDELHFIKERSERPKGPFFFDLSRMRFYNTKGGTVKIIIKQEADTTCAWIVGEDGETLPYSETNPTDGDGTAYLKSGQQVEIDVEIAARATEDGQDNYPKATMSEVTEIPATGETAGAVPGNPPVDPDVDQKAGERPGEEDQAGDDDTSVLR